MVTRHATRALWRGAAMLGMLLVPAGCSDVSITTVDPAVVEISPPSTFVPVEGTARLSAEVRSSDGALLSGRTIVWRSQADDIAEVDASGNVRGLAPGTAVIEATAEGVTGTATVVVTSGPAVRLNADTIEITAVNGGASPGDRTVSVGNPGDGTLSGLSVEIAYSPGQPEGWLEASLSSTTAPAALVLSASHAGLAVGTYTALVRVSSPVASNGTDSVTVQLVVLTPAPAIGVGANSVSFTASEGGANPSAQGVAITNAGGGTLSGLSASVSYTPGQPGGWLTAQLGSETAPATLTLRPTTGSLAAGTYTATVNVASSVAQNSPRPITVTFTVGPAQPVIGAAPASLAFTATQGGTNPASKNVQVTNTGGGTLSGLAVSVIYPGGEPAGWLSTSLSGTSAPATVTVNATVGSLAAGTYSATVRIASGVAANSPQLVDVSFVVQPPAPPGAPSGLTATAMSTGRIDLAWDAAPGVVSGYRIERRTGSGAFALVATVGAGTRTYQDTGLEAGTQYGYRVQACNGSGCSPFSSEATATTDAGSPITPSAPGGVTASATSSTQITVRWDYGSDPITHFEVERAASSTFDAIQERASLPANARELTDGGLAPSTTYYYRVRACTLIACSDWSTASATTSSFTPATPTNVSGQALSDSEILLTWNASAGATTYTVQQRRGTSGPWERTVSIPATSTQYLDTGLREETRYQYQVRACADTSCSSYSNTVNVETDDD